MSTETKTSSSKNDGAAVTVQPIVRLAARLIWDVSEFLNIGLGLFAPHVFGVMIGRRPIKNES